MLGTLKAIFQSLKKSRKLKRISRKLSEPTDLSDLMIKNKKSPLDELLDITESDKYLKILMNLYKADRQTLIKLYDKLSLLGAGQYAKGHYVSASSLVYAQTLKFLLEHFDGENFKIKGFDTNNSGIYVANRLIDYFENGEIGEIR